jgi:dihydroxyacid dehydratase/phosphogluconate dehydratase
MHVRNLVESPTTVIELTTENDRIEIDGTNGRLTLNISSEDMSEITSDKYVYDLEIVAPTSGVVHRIIQGNFVVRAEVTR